VTTPGYICSECPDATRVERGCPFGLRDERVQRRDVEPSCKVLTIPSWFFDMSDLGQRIDNGAVSPADVDGRTWELGRLASRAIADGREAAEWRAKRRREIIAAAVARGRGGDA